MRLDEWRCYRLDNYYTIDINLLISAVYLYKKKRIPIWVSAIGMALLVPVTVFCFISFGIDSNRIVGLEPDDAGEGVGFAGGFLALILGFHAIIVFVIGIIVNIYTFVKKTLKAKKIMCKHMIFLYYI